MIIKSIDLSNRTVWGINHKIRNSNPFNLFDLYKVVNYFSKKDGVQYHITTIVNQATGLNCWQLTDTYN